MSVTDNKVHPRALVGRKTVKVTYAPTVSITSRAVVRHTPKVPFELTGFNVGAVGYTATIGLDVKIGGDDCVLIAGALGVHSTPEQLTLALSRYVVGGVVVEKAAATAIAFTAAHKVTALKYGAVLIQITNAGVVSSKVVNATQAYDTYAEAVEALPAADSGKLAIGYIVIQAGVADWDAITDDLTAASDLVARTFVMTAAQPSALVAAIAPVALSEVAASLAVLKTSRRGGRADSIYVLATTDGTGALVNGVVEVEFRARTGGLIDE